MPYDLLQAGCKLSFNLGDLFPNLSYPVIEKLGRSLVDAIDEAQRKASPERMGDNATKDFVLRHAFGIAAELVTTDVELLRGLLRLHYAKAVLPARPPAASRGCLRSWRWVQPSSRAKSFFGAAMR